MTTGAPHAVTSPVRLALDHLVVGAATLEQGVAWCEAVLGVAPGPGGRHVFMGTHNRLLRLVGGAGFDLPDAYLEIIAVDPQAAPPSRPRWFGLDEPAVQAALRRGPRLLHWVARSDDLDAVRHDWAAAGVDPGPVEAAGRDTPDGPLRWRITIPTDGRPAAGGAVPALIAWQGRHPAARLDPAGAPAVTAWRWSTGRYRLGASVRGLPEGAPPGADPQAAAAPAALAVTLRGPAGEVGLRLPPAN